MKTLAEIRMEIEKLELEAKDLAKKEKSSVIKRIRSEIIEYSITLEELGFTKVPHKAGSKLKMPRYRNGELTWSGGRGVKPAWVKEILEKKGPAGLEKFRVGD